MEELWFYIQAAVILLALPVYGYYCMRLWSQAVYKSKLEYQSKFFLNFNHKQDTEGA